MDPEQAKEVARQIDPVLQQWAQELLTWAKEGKGFITEQAPLLVQEILRWGLIESLIYIVLSCFWLFAIYLVCAWQSRLPKNHFLRDWDVAASFFWVITILISLPLITSIFINILDALQVIFAPRLYLIEYIARLAGGR